MSRRRQLKKSAISDTVCQVTRGAEPTWASTPYAQWIRQRLDELGWQKQDLIARVAAASDGRLAYAGAEGMVNRVTVHGVRPVKMNQRLLDQILGSPEAEAVEEAQTVSDRLAALEAKVEQQGKAMTKALGGVERALQRLTAAIENGGDQRSPRARRAR